MVLNATIAKCHRIGNGKRLDHETEWDLNVLLGNAVAICNTNGYGTWNGIGLVPI